MLLFLMLLFLFGFTKGHNVKSTLTFVIDDTYSMSNEIGQVKEKTNQVFDAVLNSNASKIDEFVIVTFNDPDAKLYTRTKDREVFKKAVSEIVVHGGDDCPEYAMKGIELALDYSKPNSLFYVFTDAAAKDYGEYERVKSLGLKKSIQITFLLTGKCDNAPKETYDVYDKLAEATSGQVFHLEKQDVRKVIDYIIATIKNKKTNVAQKYFSDASGQSFQFSIDSKLWDIIISVTANDPSFHITGPDGKTIEAKDFISTEKSRICTLDVTPGVYTMFMDNTGHTSVVITGSTSVYFQHGFSTVKPSTINETSTKPIEDIPSYLAIELGNTNRDVILKTVEIRDFNDNYLSEYPLELIDDDKQFYVTKPIVTPNFTFKIAINGYTDGKEKITRIASTTIEHQKPELEGTKQKEPSVTILGGASITVEYDSNLSLKCKVNGFPKPDVVWTDDSETVWPSKVVPVDLPYEYMSILEINKINKNGNFHCSAKNVMGESSAFISVEAKRYTFLDIIESPKDLVIEYGNSGIINIKVNANPTAVITWYKEEKKLETDSDFVVASDGSSLTIGHMHQRLKGYYSVEASNDVETQRIDFKIDMSGEKPEIEKGISSYRIKRGSSINFPCRIIRGKPEPVISWTFQSESLGSLKYLGGKDVLHLDNIGPNYIGTYSCLARNDFGKDRYDINVFVEYAPTIEDVQSYVKVPEGEQVILTCVVDGSPYPFVRWLYNDVEISSTGKYSFNDNTLSFTSSRDDSGIYTCEASNTLGQQQKDFDVNVYIPIEMEVPKETTLELNVGSSLTLPCRAEGYPKPNVRWIFYSENPKIPPKKIKPDLTGSLSIEHVQVEDEGYYRCSASNVGGLKSITYKVRVRAPVSITNPDGAIYKAVKGDLVLRIPCKAIGSPTPKFSWTTNGFNIASGTDWYDIEDDGTLVIKSITLSSGGNYICHASNYFSSDIKEFAVDVKASPEPGTVIGTIPLELGTSAKIECDLPHNDGDVLNWFKDGELIATGELYLNNIALEDAGSYSCRVSTFVSAHTVHKKVTVGYKPKFISDEETNIEYSEGDFAYLVCSGDGDPQPKILWRRNGDVIKEKEMSLIIEMKLNDIGNYECTLSNRFGSISRSFNINSGECLLDIKYDFNEKQPLLLSLSRDWPELKTTDRYVHVPKLKYYLITCPGSSITYNGINFGPHVKTKCVENSMFEIGEQIIDFSKIKCKKEIQPLAKRSAESCFGGDTELLKVGFNLKNKFLDVYDVCIDNDQKIPLFTKHVLPHGVANSIPPRDMKFVGSKVLPFNFEDMYECSSQLSFISYLTGKSINTDDNCCFTKRQLVSPQDVLPGLSQVAVYNYLNVIPHWSSCGNRNWDELELRIRFLGKLSNDKIVVFTGASQPMMLPGQTKDANVYLSDRLNRRQPVPMYIWKVVKNPSDKSSLAVIQLNIPNLTLGEAISYMPCEDVCADVQWLSNNDWRDVNKGFTFCCSITEFALNFGGLFEGHKKVFKKLPPLVSDYSLI